MDRIVLFSWDIPHVSPSWRLVLHTIPDVLFHHYTFVIRAGRSRAVDSFYALSMKSFMYNRQF
jgi:hypothetical protein